MNGYIADTFNLILTGILILLNGFFVAAEFALVKVNKSKIKSMQKDKNPFASVALWLYKRQNMALSACQMGITMASLALGWIGEPALAHLIRPALESIGISSEAALHGIAFTIAFTLITSLHIVIGEQFPKIYAIRQPVAVVGWSALPLKFFYVLFYPFMWVLDRITSSMLRMVGIESSGEHEAILTEEEIRASLSIAYNQGDLTKNEHQLLDAAFKFDDHITRQIMLPRVEVAFLDLNKAYAENMDLVKKTKHTRFPLCNSSLDDIKGVIHIKDLIGSVFSDTSALKKLARPPLFVPETFPIPRLLQHFKKSKQHFAFVEDEYGTVIGIVTLEHVFEQLVGNVQDEFDTEKPEILKESEGKYLVEGDLSVNFLNEFLDINLETDEADTLSGLLVEQATKPLEKGQKIKLKGAVIAEIIQVKNRRAIQVRLQIPQENTME
ncbi:MAG: hemolysin family protein [Reichenbachiella sp.]|uniref:hemolysin family protein n=1 Tax=Reichenbachiella sp. TaxID=2184521 RepID=UPI0032671B9E